MIRTGLIPPTGLLFFLVAGLALADEPAEVDYLRDIKPLLARHCVSCHGIEKPRGQLRLDTAEGALEGGDLGPSVVPGAPEESELLLAVTGEGFTQRMPLNRPPLSDEETALLRAWIKAGAAHPEGEEPSTAVDATHWAFVAPVKAEPPTVGRVDRVENPIDRFILAPLERDGIAPSPPADRATLIRRASLDVIGLPPTPEEVAAFLADDRPDAYERLVDRLLASSHYGERWGRLWLDAARYADSNGYSIDAPRSIWPYRDWVIDALNADMPFDQFTVAQLAGDMLPGATLAQKVATGFHRNTQINQEGGIDKEQFRVESVIDRVNTTGTVWLGLTIGCAQCHDHKYDPIRQDEYYQLFAFLNNADEPTLPVATPELIARRAAVQREIDAYVGAIERDEVLLAKQKAWETSLTPEARQKQSQDVRESFDTPFDDRSVEKNRVVFLAFLDQAQDDEVTPHREALAAIRKDEPVLPTTLVIRELSQPRETRFLMGGDYTRPGDPVSPGTPAILPPLVADDGTPDRLDLARWLVRPDNPLTARVTVNRLWQTYFGRGLVETDGDFGTQGTPPSHPELLDWLAVTFVESGWSLKAIHRRILTSAAYRQASNLRPELAEIDPDNRRLARQSRLRLEAELIRDSAVAVAGLLVPRLGGPSVFPYQPEGVMNLGQIQRDWKADDGAGRYRRGLYTYFWRATPHPLLTGFDAPNGIQTCTRRIRSNTPLQALMLLNDRAFLEFARALADRVLTEGPPNDAGRIERIFRLCLVREPTDREHSRLVELLNAQRADFAANPADAERLASPRSNDCCEDPVEHAAWTTLARVLLNLDEFITRE